MRAAIFTEGGRGIGLGHVTRCLSLAEAFEERGDDASIFVNGGREVLSLAPNAVLLNWLDDEETFRGLLEDSDCVVIDSYLAPEQYYAEAYCRVERCLFVDDFKRLDYPGGFVLNGGVSARKLGYPEKESVKYLLGPEYAPLRKAFWDVEEKRIEQHIEKVLITFGLGGAGNITISVVEALCEEFPEMEKIVIMDPNSRKQEELERFGNVEVFEGLSAEEVKRVMLDCDVAISAGGQTTYELARVGLPSILIAVADNQIPNCEGWKEVGFALYVGRWDEVNTLGLSESLKLLEDYKVRVRMSENGKRMVDGQGARRVVRKIIER